MQTHCFNNNKQNSYINIRVAASQFVQILYNRIISGNRTTYCIVLWFKTMKMFILLLVSEMVTRLKYGFLIKYNDMF